MKIIRDSCELVELQLKEMEREFYENLHLKEMKMEAQKNGKYQRRTCEYETL
jgi:hypothetical protein